MILVDFSQVMISNVMASSDKHTQTVDENLMRHYFLNSLRGYRHKFSDEFGELVICCDNTNLWRKKIFPYYKAARRKTVAASKFDWKSLYQSLEKIKGELKETFPYKVLEVDTAEGDDIIGTLCHEFGEEMNTGERILIVSTDKDFEQLHKYGNVKQYDPVFTKKLKVNNDPEKFLKEHIIRGDTDDGIPNVLSDDDSFVLNKRQKPLIKSRMEYFMACDFDELKDQEKRNFQRNQQLIDLSFTPSDVKKEVIRQFNVENTNGRKGLMTYFIKNKLKLLMENLTDF